MSQNIAWALLLFYLIDYRLYCQYEQFFVSEPQAGYCNGQTNKYHQEQEMFVALSVGLGALSYSPFDRKANVTPTVRFLLFNPQHE